MGVALILLAYLTVYLCSLAKLVENENSQSQLMVLVACVMFRLAELVFNRPKYKINRTMCVKVNYGLRVLICRSIKRCTQRKLVY